MYQGGREDSYQRVFHNHVMCAPHCEKCKYQSVPRFGDLTIGDFWGIGQNDKQIDTSKGVSVILCNNDKGKKFLDSIPREAIGVKKGVPLEWLGGNGCVTKDSHNYASPKRDEFYKAIKEMPFSKAVDYALKPNHGIYRDIYSSSNALLQYSASFSKFQFDSSIWEEHCIDGITVLLVKPGKWQIGRYAVMPLCKALSKDKKYIFNVRFKIKTDSDIINFHVKDAGSNLYQVIHTCNVHGKNDGKEWMELSISFEPRSTIYDEFMIGASQIKGQNNFIAFDYINISEG